MRLDDVRVIGGGPAGMFAATLLRKGFPKARVTVYERSVPDDTFGFGVAFTRRTLDLLATADDAMVTALEAQSVAMPAQEIRSGSDAVFNDGNIGGIAVARSALLSVLTHQAERAGVDVRLGREASLGDVDGGDLVIAADGVGSAIRSELAAEFGETVTDGRGLFMWLGCDARLDSNLFAPVRTRHGLFNIHCYPYAADSSTIGVETDVQTWRRAGLDSPGRELADGRSDTDSIAYLQEAFGGVLGGARLVGNRSRWTHFRTVRAARWSHRNIVLLGDAAHTAHYSVGSGTKMAMEDAAELVATLRGATGSLSQALIDYERTRRPRAERLQELAARSRMWWESLQARLHLPLPVLMAAYLSRGGAVGTRKLAESDPGLLDRALRAANLCGAGRRGDDLLQAITETPWPLIAPKVQRRDITGASQLRAHECRISATDPWAANVGERLSELVESVPADTDVIILAGGDNRGGVLDRLAVAERLRTMTAHGVGVDAPSRYVEDLVDGLVGGRIDVYSLSDRA